MSKQDRTEQAAADDALGRRLDAATAGLSAPLAAVDLTALDANAADLVRRAGGRPVRVASKSVRCRTILKRVLARPGWQGVLAYSLPEALWLVRTGSTDDVLVAYPTTDTAALRELAQDQWLRAAVVLMADDPTHLDLAAEAAAQAGAGPLRVALDVDCSLRVGPVHLGVRRSPLRTPADVTRMAKAVAGHDGLRLAGMMFYEAQVAGLSDSRAAVRVLKQRSLADLSTRRAACVAAAQDAVGYPLELVNGGGSGSLEVTAADPAVTELSAGSGLYCPTLFDEYRAFTARPAAWFALPVVRRPALDVATCFSGGYVASGPAGRDRLPSPVAPSGLRLLGTEGGGEVQTPVAGATARRLRVGDRVWFRHAKAGELCERFNELHLVEDEGVVAVVPTYRGEGRSFG